MWEHWINIKDSTEAQKSLISLIETIKGQEDRRIDQYKNYSQLYLDAPIAGFKPGEWYTEVTGEESDVYTWNVIRSCVDTLTSKIGYNIPAPKVLTSGAKEDSQDKARKYEKFLKAVFQGQSVETKARAILRDCLIYGIGIAKIFPRENMVEIEKIHPSRILVDNNAFLTGDIKEIYQVEYVSAAKLHGMFPDKEQVIEEAKETAHGPTQSAKRMVTVYEAWSISEDPDVPSRHMIITDNGTLLDEEWPHDCIPFVFLRYSDDLMGFYGIGLAQQLESIQREISYIIQKIQINIDLTATSFILKHKSSNIPDEFLASNEAAKIIPWEGNIPPQVITPPAVSSQVFEYLENLFQKAYNISGLSQLSAASRPFGHIMI